MAKGWDQPSKVELDAALRSMVREIGLVGSRAGMLTEAVDLELKFTLEIEPDGEVRPVVHLGGELPESEVHTVRVALRPQGQARAAQDQSPTTTEVDLSGPAQEAMGRVASKPSSSRRRQDPAASPPPKPTGGAKPQQASPRIRPAASPVLKLRKASAGQAASSKPKKSADGQVYRSEIDVDSGPGPVVEERHASVDVDGVAAPVVVEERGARPPRPPKNKRPEPSKEAPPAEPKKPAGAKKRPGGQGFVVFDSQRKRPPEVSIEMLDTAEFDEDDGGDTMVTGVPPSEDEDTSTE